MKTEKIRKWIWSKNEKP